MVIIGGSEANTQLSKSIRSKWLHRGSIKYREAVFYLFSANDLSWYIIRTKQRRLNSSNNDIIAYLRTLNSLEGYQRQEDSRLTLDDLTKQSLINALNPFQFISTYAFLVAYIWEGKGNQQVPMVRIRGIRYLPSFRLGLTPFGSEVYFVNFIVSSQRVINAYFRHGISTFHRSEGFGIDVDNLFSNQHISLDSSLGLWHQPSLLLGRTRTTNSRSGLGGTISGRLFYKIRRSHPSVSLAFRIGYKTAGFLEGEQIRKGYSAGIGISFVE